MDKDTNQFCTAKLSDFGTSREKLVTESELDTKFGAAGYMGPEVLQGASSFPVNVWSYGITLYTIAFNKLPSAENLKIIMDGQVKYPAEPL